MKFRDLYEKVNVTLNTKGQNVYLNVGKEKILVNYDSDRQKIIDKLQDYNVKVDKSVESLITKALINAGDK